MSVFVCVYLHCVVVSAACVCVVVIGKCLFIAYQFQHVGYHIAREIFWYVLNSYQQYIGGKTTS